jgi:hypothetical protein
MLGVLDPLLMPAAPEPAEGLVADAPAVDALLEPALPVVAGVVPVEAVVPDVAAGGAALEPAVVIPAGLVLELSLPLQATTNPRSQSVKALRHRARNVATSNI